MGNAAAAPYQAGCELPVAPKPATWTSDAVTATLHKSRGGNLTRSVEAQIVLNGTAWAPGYTWRLAEPSPHWLYVPMLQGPIPEPPGATPTVFHNTLVSITIELNATGLAENTYSQALNISVRLNSGEWQQLPPFHVAFIISADPDVTRSQFTGTEAAGDESKPVVGEFFDTFFTAFDFEGEPLLTSGGAAFSASVETNCSHRSTNCKPTDRAVVQYLGGSNYVVRYIPENLGRYSVIVRLGDDQLERAPVEVVCPAGTFQGSDEVCSPCRAVGLGCAQVNTTLDTVELYANHWRLTGTTTTLYECTPAYLYEEYNHTACIGGRSVGEYCAANLTGPKCAVCSVPAQYFDPGAARCSPCELYGGAAAARLAGLTLACVLAAAGAMQAFQLFSSLRSAMRYASNLVSRLGLISKAKQVVGRLLRTTVFALHVHPARQCT